jgi:TolB protein
MDIDGTNAKRILDNGSGISNYQFAPSISADGNKVLYVSTRFDIFSLNIDGSQNRNLTNSLKVRESSPRFSPKGDKIVFTTIGKGNSDINVMSNDGSNRSRLTVDGKANDYAPTWSPDGSKILFYSNRAGSPELYLMNIDGSGVKPLLDAQVSEAAGFSRSPFVDAFDNNMGSYIQYTASFSSDGKKIAFGRDVKGNREIFTVNHDGSNIRQLTFNSIHDGFPVFVKTY